MRAKVTGSKHKFRIIIFRMKKNDDYVYFHIITNLPEHPLPCGNDPQNVQRKAEH